MVQRKKPDISKLTLPDFRSGVKRSEEMQTVRGTRGTFARGSRRLLTALGLCGFVVVFSWLLYSSRTAVVTAVIVTEEGAYVPVDQSRIISAASRYLDESFLNRWFLNESRLLAAVQADNPEIARASIAVRSGRELTLEVAGRKRAVIWQKDAQYFEVDTAGVVFRESDVSALAGAVRVIDETGLPILVGQPLTTGSFMNQIEALTAIDSRSDSYSIEHFIAPVAARELHFKLVDKPYAVKTLLETPPEVIHASLVDSLTFFAEQNTAPSTSVDLRVSGKAIYR